MARTPAPPGPPPRHYRPPGAPRPTAALPGVPLGSNRQAPQERPPDGLTAGAAVVVALATLVLGMVVGFFVGRAVERDEAALPATPPAADPTTTTTRRPGDTIPQDPPQDPGTPPSTDLEPATIGTLDNPIPQGQAYVLGLYEIQVRDVDHDAVGTLTDHDPSNPPPPTGQQHVLVQLTVRYTNDNGIANPAAISFFVTDGTSEWHAWEATCGRIPAPIVETGLIDRGRDATGHVCFTAPAEVVQNLVLGTDGFSGPVYFALDG